MRDVAGICSDLVRIRSENPPGDTADVTEYIQEFLSTIGLETRMVTRGGKSNLLSRRNEKKLLLCGHIDVVPALDDGWQYPPFSGQIADGYVHGRGSTDMKGGCASILAALGQVVQDGIEPGVEVAFVCDEEGKGDFGMEYLVRSGEVRPEECIIAEPTPVGMPVIGEKGMLRLNMTFSGDAGHSSLHPVVGGSAIMQACSIIQFCQDLSAREYPLDQMVNGAIKNTSSSLAEVASISRSEAEKIFSHIMYNPGTIHGGERVNMIAQKCRLELDMRLPWGCSPEKLLSEIEARAGTARIEVEDMIAPSCTGRCPLLDLVSAGIEEIYLMPARPAVMWAATDARFLRKIGTKVIVYGPGEISLLHSVNEKVQIEMLEKTQKVFEYCIKTVSQT